MRSAIKRLFCFCAADSKGYSLIESAIVMSVVGILLASFATAYNVYIQTQRQLTTENNASAVTAAISNYLIQKGSYPCPARMDAQRTDTDYGIAGQCDPTDLLPVSATNPFGPYVTLAAGVCGGGAGGKGWCEETSDRTGPALAKPLVRRGMVPFRTLGLPEDNAEDGYKSRFAYAATEALAVPATYSQTIGAIEVLNTVAPLTPVTFANQLVKPPAGSGGSVHYILISAGADRAGAYSRFGQLLSACTAGSLDSENCNTGPSANAKTAVYTLAEYSRASGAKHFDDYVKFYSSVETPLWKVSDSAGYNISDLINAGPVGGGKVGVGLQAPSTTLEVAGEVHVQQDTHAAELCPTGATSPGWTNCIPTQFTGTCPAGTYATGWDHNTIQCHAMASTCPTGQVMYGVDATGNLKCQTVVGCPITNVTLCNPNPSTGLPDNQVIPAGIQNQVWTSPISGVSYQTQYKCSSNGQWKKVSGWPHGTCTCAAVDEMTTTTCNAYKGTGNWTGVATYHHVHTCPANTDTNTFVSAACTCAAQTTTSTGSCPANFTGSTTTTQDWVCDSASAGHYNSPVTTSACTCVGVTGQLSTQSCQTGYSGIKTYTSDFVCPAGTWTTPSLVSNTCVCTGGNQYSTGGCTAPLVGTIDYVSTFDCTTNTWGPPTAYQNNCSAVTYNWRATSTATTGFSGPLTIHLNDTCSSPALPVTSCSAPNGSTYDHYDTCQCE